MGLFASKKRGCFKNFFSWRSKTAAAGESPLPRETAGMREDGGTLPVSLQNEFPKKEELRGKKAMKKMKKGGGESTCLFLSPFFPDEKYFLD